MKRLVATVMHKLPNRVRIKFSEPIKYLDNFKHDVTAGGEDIQMRYSPVTQTIVASFDFEEVSLQEVIYKLLTAFSIENGMMPVKVIDGVDQRGIGKFAMYSGASIAMAGINMLINGNDVNLQNRMNWFSVGVTTAAIADHAFREINRKGVFDLEILPALYLLKSFITTPKLSLVAMTWLTTFGRHLFTITGSAKEVKFFRIRNKKENKYCYIADVSEYRNVDNIGDFVNQVFFKKGRMLTKTTEKYITINN